MKRDQKYIVFEGRRIPIIRCIDGHYRKVIELDFSSGEHGTHEGGKYQFWCVQMETPFKGHNAMSMRVRSGRSLTHRLNLIRTDDGTKDLEWCQMILDEMHAAYPSSREVVINWVLTHPKDNIYIDLKQLKALL